MFLRRRRLIATTGLAAASPGLPRIAIGQADRRPSITIAVQQIANSAPRWSPCASSPTSAAHLFLPFERLITQNLMGQLEEVPGLAESWKRLDERTVELALRKGVKFHNGDEMTADDVVFTFSRERMFGPEYDITSTKTLFTSVLVRDLVEGKKLPPEVPAVAKRMFPALEKVEAIDKYTVRFTNRTPDVTLEGRIGRMGSDIICRRAYDEARTWMDWSRAPVATGPYKVREFLADQSLTIDAHDDYWGGQPPLKSVKLVVVPEVATPHQRPAVRPVRLHLRRAARPDPGHREERQVRGAGQPDRQPPPHGVRQEPSAPSPIRACARPSATRSTARPSSKRCGRAARACRPACNGNSTARCSSRTGRCRTTTPPRPGQLLKDANYKGEPIPYRLLSNYYTNQVATAQVLVEMWRQVGLNVRSR